MIITQRKIKFLYKHLRARTEIGKVIIINLQWAQVQAGRMNPIFTSDDRIDYIENNWVIHLHHELRSMTGKLLCTDIPSGILLRANDRYLMDAWDEEGLPTQTLTILNYCRLYLKVTRLSDIVTNDGNRFQDHFVSGSNINRKVTHDWPRQEKPCDKAWKLWKYHLEKTFCSGSRLRTPLGKWHTTSSSYDTVYIPELNLIQKQTKDGIFTADVITTRTKITSCGTWNLAKHKRQGIPLIEYQQIQTIPSTQWALSPSPVPWAVQLTKTWYNFYDTLQRFTTVKKYAELDLLTTDKIWIVLDGGLHDTNGYYGWVIASDNDILYEGNGRVPSNSSQSDSL